MIPPPAGILWPSTIFSPSSCARGLKKNVPAFSRSISARRHSACPGSAAAARRKDGPASETTRNFLHVFLCVAAVNAERVQLHQFARVVLIDAASLSCAFAVADVASAAQACCVRWIAIARALATTCIESSKQAALAAVRVRP